MKLHQSNVSRCLSAPIMFLALGAVACSSGQTEPETPETAEEAPDEGDSDLYAAAASDEDEDFLDPATEGPVLEIPLIPKSGSSVAGEIKLTESVEGVTIEVMARDLEPGLHGVHLHEVADCSAEDASSAGGHYDPLGSMHGLPEKEAEHHVGDLGNMTVDQDGNGSLEHMIANVNLEEGSDMSLQGRALIIHADPDTGEQPTGGSGARIACAEITSEAAAKTQATAPHEH